MKKFFLRLFLFLIFIPILILIIYQFNFLNFILLNLLILFFAITGAIETKNFFKADPKIKSGWLIILLSSSFPVLAYFLLWFRNLNNLQEIWIIAVIIIIFIKVTFYDCRKDFSHFFPNFTSSIITVIYPGLLLSYLIKLLSFNYPAHLITLFIGSVFGNDICAYLGGKFLGSKTRLNLKISPNKTLIGFIAGIGFSILFTVFFYYAVPEMFQTNLLFIILFAILISITTIMGDLIESAIKRAVNIKDSGTLMLGRGGILDSIDSILISAPVFYFLYPLISG